MHFNSVSILLIAAYFASVVNAHGAIIAATGDAGGQGTALGSKYLKCQKPDLC